MFVIFTVVLAFWDLGVLTVSLYVNLVCLLLSMSLNLCFLLLYYSAIVSGWPAAWSLDFHLWAILHWYLNEVSRAVSTQFVWDFSEIWYYHTQFSGVWGQCLGLLFRGWMLMKFVMPFWDPSLKMKWGNGRKAGSWHMITRQMTGR